MRGRRAGAPPKLTALDVQDAHGFLVGRIWQEAPPGAVSYFAVHRCGRRSPHQETEAAARRWLDQTEVKHDVRVCVC